MEFAQLAAVFAQLEKIRSGNAMRAVLSKFFKKVPKKDMRMVAYFSVGSITFSFDDLVLGMAEKMVLKSIAQASGASDAEVKKLFKKKGDVGKTAEAVVGRKRAKLSVKDVFTRLHTIARASGAGSQDKKIRALAELLQNASPLEAKYIAKIALGQLSLGVGDMTVLDALAIAFTGSKASRKRLEHAYNICPDLGEIAELLAIKGLKGIDKIGVKVGRPIQMMRAQRSKTLEDVRTKIPGVIAAEEKYDGERVQAHKIGPKVVLFSRRLDNITEQFPDVVAEIKKNIKAQNCVIEGEICPVGPKGTLLPFQVLMQRRRKHDVEKYSKKIPVCTFLFELLYLNGTSYLRKSYPERHKALEKIVKQSKKLRMVRRVVSNDISKIEDFFNQTMEWGSEGIIAKSTALDSVYRAGARAWQWVKWKREYAKEMRDTFDVVVIGAFVGRGKRAGTYGSLLCAVYNEKNDTFESFCKLGSGFTDKQLAELPKKFRPVAKKPARVVVKKELKPDFWFMPKNVMEVVGAEITKSPLHACGVALRFPRIVRYRPDKKPEQATSVKEVKKMMR